MSYKGQKGCKKGGTLERPKWGTLAKETLLGKVRRMRASSSHRTPKPRGGPNLSVPTP